MANPHIQLGIGHQNAGNAHRSIQRNNGFLLAGDDGGALFGADHGDGVRLAVPFDSAAVPRFLAAQQGDVQRGGCGRGAGFLE